jgi:hypothetical protein
VPGRRNPLICRLPDLGSNQGPADQPIVADVRFLRYLGRIPFRNFRELRQIRAPKAHLVPHFAERGISPVPSLENDGCGGLKDRNRPVGVFCIFGKPDIADYATYSARERVWQVLIDFPAEALKESCFAW